MRGNDPGCSLLRGLMVQCKGEVNVGSGSVPSEERDVITKHNAANSMTNAVKKGEMEKEYKQIN